MSPAGCPDIKLLRTCWEPAIIPAPEGRAGRGGGKLSSLTPKECFFFGLALRIVPGGSDVGDLGSIPGSGRSPGGGNGNPLQYSCLENPMRRGAWQATDHGVAESDTTEVT